MGSKERCRKMKDGGEYRRELGRTRANSRELRRTFGVLRRTFGVLRRTFGGVRRSVGVCELMTNSREFARVRPSSREFAANDSSPGILPEYQ